MKPGHPLLLSSGLLEIGIELDKHSVRLSRAESKADPAKLDLEAVGEGHSLHRAHIADLFEGVDLQLEASYFGRQAF